MADSLLRGIDSDLIFLVIRDTNSNTAVVFEDPDVGGLYDRMLSLEDPATSPWVESHQYVSAASTIIGHNGALYDTAAKYCTGQHKIEAKKQQRIMEAILKLIQTLTAKLQFKGKGLHWLHHCNF